MTVVLTRDEHTPARDEVAVLESASPETSPGGIDTVAARRIALKLLWALVLILLLMLFSADEVDFVYKGF
ncbi:MAG TPA: hypothetical protein VF190_07520 [Rhodothermales bacterium]